MENIFYNDEFYNELGDLLEELEINENNLEKLSEDYQLICYESSLEPVVTLSEDWISDRMDDERLPEDDDTVFSNIAKALRTIDFEKVNAMMPKLYYPKKKKIIFSKQDIIDYCK